METNIRLFKKGDIKACVDIILKTGAGSNKKEVQKLLGLSLKSGISFINPDYYVLNSDKKIIGISGLYYDYEDPKDILWMDYFAVLPEFQNQGLGTKMLKNLEAICLKKGARMLCVFAETQQAINFYQKNGFEICGRINNYYGQDRPRVWLSKLIKK